MTCTGIVEASVYPSVRCSPACPPPHFAHALQVQEMMLGGLDSSVLDRIAKILSYMTVQGGCHQLAAPGWQGLQLAAGSLAGRLHC